jgi:hypothetical protein
MNTETNSVTYDNTTGQKTTGNRTLYTAFSNGFIPSMSYGLHIGSVYHNITPSLYWGGYDSARLLGPPITSNNDTFILRDISMTVSSGGGAYLNNSANSTIPILSSSGIGQTPIVAKPDPGPPYMYLPKSVCDSIATHLPVSYNKDFNLYIWDTTSSAYIDILSSPHSLTFTFDSAIGSGTNINVPFALLKLTLDYPLVQSPIQYFPCSPYTPSSSTGNSYILGRAFLQAAFIGGTWSEKKLFLAQAPGPAVQPENIKTIGTTDLALSSWQSSPSWDQTWALTLKALPGTFNNSVPTPDTSTGSPSPSPSSGKKSGISGGAIAGIVIGVVALLALIALGAYLWRRRKRSQSRGAVPLPHDEYGAYRQEPAELSGSAQHPVEKSAVPDGQDKIKEKVKDRYDIPAQGPPAELAASSPR